MRKLMLIAAVVLLASCSEFELLTKNQIINDLLDREPNSYEMRDDVDIQEYSGKYLTYYGYYTLVVTDYEGVKIDLFDRSGRPITGKLTIETRQRCIQLLDEYHVQDGR